MRMIYLLLRGEKHPSIGKESRQREGGVHWSDHACSAPWFQHTVRLRDRACQWPCEIKPVYGLVNLDLHHVPADDEATHKSPV